MANEPLIERSRKMKVPRRRHSNFLFSDAKSFVDMSGWIFLVLLCLFLLYKDVNSLLFFYRNKSISFLKTCLLHKKSNNLSIIGLLFGQPMFPLFFSNSGKNSPSPNWTIRRMSKAKTRNVANFGI